MLGTLGAATADEALLVIDVHENGQHSQTPIPLSQASYNAYTSTYSWQPSGSRSIGALDGGSSVSLQNVNVQVRCYPPRINCQFTVRSGAHAAQIEVQALRVDLPADSASAPSARAQASVGLYDLGNDGASVAGIGAPGAGIFHAVYNSNSDDPQTFSSLVGQVTAGAGGVASGQQNDPAFGLRSVGEAVSDIGARFAWQMSAGDEASFNGLFELSDVVDARGDVNCDGSVSVGDVAGFIAAMSGPAGFGLLFPGCPMQNADFNADGQVTAADIPGFLNRILGSV